MAHWVGILNDENKVVVTGATKQEVIGKIASQVTRQSRWANYNIGRQLSAMREPVAVVYASETEQIAKVFPCNCGSVKRHTEIREVETA